MSKLNILRIMSLGLIACALLNSTSFGAEKKIVIKLATIAPEGSAWMRVFNELNADLKAKTENRVRFRIYPGGVLGDEKDMLRKMFIGQIHGAALLAPGLSTLMRDVNVTQVPFLFETYDEVDYVLSQMEAHFKKGFEDKGYVLMGWSEGGFVRMMSTVPINTLSELIKAKVWTWEEAPIAQAIFDEAKISAIPLSIPDVLLGLQSDMIQVVYAPPAGAISLQWFVRTKYMTDVPLMYLAGGIVIKKRVLSKISKTDLQIMSETIDHHMIKLKDVIRKQNQEAMAVMEKHGVKILKPTREEIDKFKTLSNKAMQRLANDEMSKDVLNEVYGHLEAYRKDKK